VEQAYPYTRQYAYQYSFVSYGKERIEKIATFASAPEINAFSFVFGDLLADGTTDTYANSNNGDMPRVIATIICIIKQFLDEHPDTTVFFIGSTSNRTLLYRRLLKTNYSIFNKEFIINALIQAKNRLLQVPFDPFSNAEYLGFFIKKIN
jgi:hypothetical protein